MKKGDIIYDGEDYGRVIKTEIVDLKALEIDSFEKLLIYFHKLEPHPRTIKIVFNVSWVEDDEALTADEVNKLTDEEFDRGVITLPKKKGR